MFNDKVDFKAKNVNRIFKNHFTIIVRSKTKGNIDIENADFI